MIPNLGRFPVWLGGVEEGRESASLVGIVSFIDLGMILEQLIPEALVIQRHLTSLFSSLFPCPLVRLSLYHSMSFIPPCRIGRDREGEREEGAAEEGSTKWPLLAFLSTVLPGSVPRTLHAVTLCCRSMYLI